MLKSFLSVLTLLSVVLLCINSGCKKEEAITPIESTETDEGVQVNLSQFPLEKLSSYQFFTGDMADQLPNERVYPYKPASQLFTDYAKKKRFIWLPQGEKATYTADKDLFSMPVGTVLIKTFYYNNVQPNNETRILETRVMLKKQSGWEFAEYVWNSAQDEATLKMDGDNINLSWDQDGTMKTANYRIPSETECMICHKFESEPIPIGVKPQNLNVDYDYGNGPENQLNYLVNEGVLTDNLPANIVTVVDYLDESEQLDKRVRSYLDINCAHCHQEGSHCSYRPLRLAFSETDLESNIGVCVEPDEFINTALTYIITPSNTERSVMHYRLKSTDQNEMMPLLGRSIVHDEGVQLIEDYINSLLDPC